MSSRRTARRHRAGLAGRTLAGLLSATLLAGTTPAVAETCLVSPDQGGMRFPVERMDAAALCLVSAVTSKPTTAGSVGPLRTPIPQPLYEYLLDHPLLIASLTQKLGMGNYQVTRKGPQQFWGADGDGTQGLLSLVQREGTSRVYHIDGYHEGRFFPLVLAKAVVFLKISPAALPDGHQAVDTSMMVYTRLNDPILASLVWMLRPLVGEAVTRKLTRGFEVTTQIGAAIAQNPDRILQAVPSLPQMDQQEQRTFSALLQNLPAAGTQPARLAP